MFHFRDHQYLDDRIVILYQCRGRVSQLPDRRVETTISYKYGHWDDLHLVAIYYNRDHYPLLAVRHFRNAADAVVYIRTIEPTTPLISYGGCSPKNPLSFDKYCNLKKKQRWRDFDYHLRYYEYPDSPREHFYQSVEEYHEGLEQTKNILAIARSSVGSERFRKAV